MNIEIANKLQKLRKEKGYSQEELANKLGVSRQAISKWERAEASPDTDNLICLAKVYDISLDELLSSSDEEVKDIVEQKQEELSKKSKLSKIKDILLAVLFLISAIVYLILGFTLSLWHPAWLIFLVPVIIASIVDVIDKKNIGEFNMPLLVALIYLMMGFFGNLWHPGWVVFIIIPIFYIVSDTLKKK